MNKIQSDDNGFALVTVLLFSLVTLGIAMGAYFMIIYGTKISGIEKQYMSELDKAKGTAEYVMGRLVANNIRCNGGNICIGDSTCSSTSSKIDIPTALCNALGKEAIANGCQDLTACYVSKKTMTEIDPVTMYTNTIDIVAVNVQSRNAGGEKADIDFVYKIQ